MKKKLIHFKQINGKNISQWILPIAELRIKIFKEWPYLYQGDLAYEKKYLSRYSKAQNSLFVLAFDHDQLIGASSCIHLIEESDLEIKKPFLDQKFNLADVVYFGESILDSNYRGLKIGSYFMTTREQFAKEICQARYATFCSVIRSETHPLKPQNYNPLNLFWEHKKFKKQDHMFCKMLWLDLNDSIETEKKLQFWLKEL